MPFCPNCGAQADEGAKFCSECGSQLHKPRPAARGPRPTKVRRNFLLLVLILCCCGLLFVVGKGMGWFDFDQNSDGKTTPSQSGGYDIPPSEGHPYWEHFGNQPPYLARERIGSLSEERVHLVNNKSAADPTWEELTAFLLADETDDIIYSAFCPCGCFAEKVHNNAEAAGIRAGWVAVDFVGETTGHALNAFKTTDRGLIYVDCTGEGFLSLLSSGESWLPVVRDRIAYVVVGREYGTVCIVCIKDIEDHLSYEDYEQYIETCTISCWEPLGVVEAVEIWW